MEYYFSYGDIRQFLLISMNKYLGIKWLKSDKWIEFNSNELEPFINWTLVDESSVKNEWTPKITLKKIANINNVFVI